MASKKTLLAGLMTVTEVKDAGGGKQLRPTTTGDIKRDTSSLDNGSCCDPVLNGAAARSGAEGYVFSIGYRYMRSAYAYAHTYIPTYVGTCRQTYDSYVCASVSICLKL